MPKDISRLIPIKKPITDIQKGLIIRTYYYRPQTLLKQLEKLKQDPNINYFGDTPFYSEYESFLKTQDKSEFAKFFDNKTWEKVSTIENSPEINKHVESKFVYPLTSFLLSGDKIFLKNLKKGLREASKERIVIPIEYKFKTRKSFSKPFKEGTVYNVTKVSNILSNIINYYNPRKPKLVEIVKKLIGSDYIDDSGIIHHCVFSERSINRERDLFLNLMKSNIYIFYSNLLESKKDVSHLIFYIPYFLVEIFKIDVNVFANVLKTYYFSETIREFSNEIQKNKLSDKLNIYYAQLVNLPKEELFKYLKEKFMDDNTQLFDRDEIIIRAISMRSDITHGEYDIIMERFLNKYDIFDRQTLIANLINYFFNHQPPSLLTSLYLYSLHQHYKKIPIYFVKDFKGCEPERGSILFMMANTKKTKEYIFNNIMPLKEENKRVKCYIPIIKKDQEMLLKDNKIPFRLLEFHLASLNEEEIKNKYIYVELEVDKFLRLTDSLIMVNI